jgi:two-component system LytT family response regulator
VKYLLIEDEIPAAKRLQRMITEIAPDFENLDVIESVASATEWFSNNRQPDFCIMDIELADGHSFEIFNRVKIDCPVIFTTAFDEYAVKAFRLNSIDYLLKPVKAEELEVALGRVREHLKDKEFRLPDIAKLFGTGTVTKEYQKRILIRFGDTIKALEIADAAYFYTESRINYMIAKDGASYPIDMNLDQLEKVLDPSVFFRINRQFIIHVKAIKKMTAWSKSRLKLDLQPPCQLETIVSTERSPEFRTWITGSPQGS